MDDPLDPVPPTPDELLRMFLAPSDGRTPVGTLALIQSLGASLAAQAGAELPSEADQHRPETHDERSAKIVAAECLAQPAIDQSEAANPNRVATHNQLTASNQLVELLARDTDIKTRILALLAAFPGFAVSFAIQTESAVARSGE